MSREMLVRSRERSSAGIVLSGKSRTSSPSARGGIAIAMGQGDWGAMRRSRGSDGAFGGARHTWNYRLSILTSPSLVKSLDRLRMSRQLFSGPIWNFTEADRAACLFVIGDLVPIFATFLHVVAVPGLNPIGAVNLLPHGPLLCHGVKDTIVVGGEGRRPLDE